MIRWMILALMLALGTVSYAGTIYPLGNGWYGGR